MGRTVRKDKPFKGKKTPKKGKIKGRGMKGSVRNLDIDEDYGSFEKFKTNITNVKETYLLSPFKQDNLIPTDDGNTGDDDPPIEELDEYQILQLETGIK